MSTLNNHDASVTSTRGRDRKTLLFKIRTPEALEDWLNFVSRIEKWVRSPKYRLNGKQKSGDGFYSSFQCEVESRHVIDVLTEHLAFLESRNTSSFEMVVRDSHAK